MWMRSFGLILVLIEVEVSHCPSQFSARTAKPAMAGRRPLLAAGIVAAVLAAQTSFLGPGQPIVLNCDQDWFSSEKRLDNPSNTGGIMLPNPNRAWQTELPPSWV